VIFLNNIVYNSVNFKTTKPKLFVIAASPYSIENFNELYSDFEVGIITSFFQKSLPPNTIIINPDLKQDISNRFMLHNRFESPELISNLASEDDGLHNLLIKLLSQEPVVYMKPLTMNAGLNFMLPGVQVLASSSDAVSYFDNKLDNKKLLDGKVRLNKSLISFRDNLLSSMLQLDSGSGVAVATGLGGGGTGVRRIRNQGELIAWLSEKNDDFFVVEPWLENSKPLATYAIVDSFGNVLPSAIAQMYVKNETSWCGTMYKGSVSSLHAIYDMLNSISSELASFVHPFKGLFGVDFLQDAGATYFMEINPRSGGTSLESALHMDTLNPKKKKFMDIEAQVLLGGKIEDDYISETKDFVWKKQVVQFPYAVKVIGDFPLLSKKDMFAHLQGGIFGVYEKGTIIPVGHPVANILSVAKNESDCVSQENDLLEKINEYVKRVD